MRRPHSLYPTWTSSQDSIQAKCNKANLTHQSVGAGGPRPYTLMILKPMS